MKVLKVFYILFLLLFLGSCSFFTKKQQDTAQTDTVIDFTSVDTYPLFSNCENMIDTKERKKCFQSEISKRINSLLQSKSFQASGVIQDTILLQLKIDKKGEIHLINSKKENLSQFEYKKIDSTLRAEFQKFPKLQPATKRGIPVTTVFTLPLILTQ